MDPVGVGPPWHTFQTTLDSYEYDMSVGSCRQHVLSLVQVMDSFRSANEAR